jgi:curved DNA-binding protein CbpA
VTQRDYYEILGIPKDTPDYEIKKRYRQLALKYHPDRNKDSKAPEKFKEISEAYSILSDNQKRQLYDSHGHAGIDNRYSNMNYYSQEDYHTNDVWGWRSKGSSLYSMGNYKEAITCYNEGIKIDPDNRILWNNKGLAQYAMGEYEAAILSYEHLITIDPKDAYTWNNKGLAQYAMKKYEAAILSYDKVITIDPDDADAWHNKGDALNSLGKSDEAEKCYDKSKELGYDI